MATWYFYWWCKCAGREETVVIENDKLYAACRKERLTGFMLVGRRYRLSCHEEWSCCYLINNTYYILQHIRIETVWCLPSSVCRVLRPIKMAENIFIKELLYRVSQQGWTKLRESVPYIKIYQYNPQHLWPKLNGYGDKGQGNVQVNVPQHIALSQPSGSVSHKSPVLSFTTCRLPPAFL